MKKILFVLSLFTAISIMFSCNEPDELTYYCNGHQDTIHIYHYDTVVVNNYDTVIINNTDDYYVRINVAYKGYTIDNDYRCGSFGLRHVYCNNEFNEIVDYISCVNYDASDTIHANFMLGPVKHGFKTSIQCVESKAMPLACEPWTYFSDERVPFERNNIQISISKNREPFTLVKEGIGELEYTIE